MDALEALRGEPLAHLARRDDRAVEPLGERHRPRDVVVVSVRERDQVAAPGLDLVGRALRVAVEPRIEVDAGTGRGVEAEGRVPEPGEGERLWHLVPELLGVQRGDSDTFWTEQYSARRQWARKSSATGR
jgi:hypothetical protein